MNAPLPRKPPAAGKKKNFLRFLQGSRRPPFLPPFGLDANRFWCVPCFLAEGTIRLSLSSSEEPTARPVLVGGFQQCRRPSFRKVPDSHQEGFSAVPRKARCMLLRTAIDLPVKSEINAGPSPPHFWPRKRPPLPRRSQAARVMPPRFNRGPHSKGPLFHGVGRIDRNSKEFPSTT